MGKTYHLISILRKIWTVSWWLAPKGGLPPGEYIFHVPIGAMIRDLYILRLTLYSNGRSFWMVTSFCNYVTSVIALVGYHQRGVGLIGIFSFFIRCACIFVLSPAFLEGGNFTAKAVDVQYNWKRPVEVSFAVLSTTATSSNEWSLVIMAEMD